MAKRKGLMADMGREREPTLEERQEARDTASARRSESSAQRRVRVLELELEAERVQRELAIKWAANKPIVHKIDPLKLPARGRRAGLPHLVTCSMFSDLHVDEPVDPGMVSGLNEFDLKIAESRLQRAFRSVAKLVRKEQAHGDVRTHIVWIGGDLFSGHIHDDLVESVAMAPMESIFWLRSRITAGLKFLCETLDVEEIVVVWQYGNHGRNTMKPRVQTAAEHNFEWMLGQFMQQDILAQPWAKKKRMRFIAERGYHTYLDAGGFVIRFHHGDNVKFYGGSGGLTIPLNKAIGKWNEARRADLDVIGHWHQETDMAHAVVNGSLIGYNAYAVAIKAGFEPPAQGFFEVDLARRKKTGYFTVHVTPKPDEVKDLQHNGSIWESQP